MWTSSQVQKDIRITHLNHWPKNLINKYIHYKSNVLSTFSWLEPVLTPALDIGIAKSGSNLVHSPQAIFSVSRPVQNQENIFTVSYPVLWWCTIKLIWIAKVSVFLKILMKRLCLWPWTSEKKYFWMILWLMMMHHHTKFDRSEILSGQTFTEVQNLHCDLDSKANFSQDTPAYEYSNAHLQK